MTVVNFSTGPYLKGQKRLSRSLNNPRQLMFDKYNDINSPTHEQSPYEFKIHTIEKGFEADDIVLWCDSSLWRVGDLSKIEEIIKSDGYFMEEAGHYVKDWCNDHAKRFFKWNDSIDRKMTMFSAGLIGLDCRNPLARKFFDDWKYSALAGCFRGNWSNHRHDMTCGSIIAQRMGLKYQRGGSHMAYIGPGYSEPEPGVVFYLQGV